MANYTITRSLESGHEYGCTQFSTVQEEGQVASHAANTPLDATIVWDLKANPGFVVDVQDFAFAGFYDGTGMVYPNEIPNTIPGVTLWGDLPSPILWGKMEQLSSTLIKITLLLAPDANQPEFTSGQAFEMPQDDINLVLSIEGCAKYEGHGLRWWFNSDVDTFTNTDISISEDLRENIVTNYINEEVTEVHGTLPPESIDREYASPGDYVMSYIVSASEGY